MHSQFAVSIFLAGALSFWLASPPVHAATRTASLVITATVEAECDVSPASAQPEIGGSGQVSSTPTVSVNCSLPVAYQIVVSGAPGNRNGAAGLPRTEYAATPAYANSRNPERLKAWSLPYGASPLIDESAIALQDLFFLDLNAGSMNAASCSLFGAPPQTGTLTIIY
jgi:hypothetical protein